jgi:hypothetical protein
MRLALLQRRGLSIMRRISLLCLLTLVFPVLSPAQAQALFRLAHYFPTGAQPVAIAAGDLNGDRVPDLVTANSYQDEFAVLLGVGDGSFEPPMFVGAGGSQTDVACADLNGDEILDVVVPMFGQNGRIKVLLGLGDGTFAPRVQYVVGDAPEAVAIGDVNRDSIPDLVVACYPDSVDVLLGVGDGRFGPPLSYAAGSIPYDVVIEDLNADQIPDLVVAAMNADRVAVLLGSGDGTFGPPAFYDATDQPWDVALGDFNGDSAPDIVASNPGYAGDDNITVFLNRGDGTYEPATIYWVGDGPFSVAVADFNSDQILDIVTTNAYSNNVAVLLGNGDGSFNQPVHYYAGDGAHSVAVGDYNGDQVPDLAVADKHDDCVAVLLGTTNPATVQEQAAHFSVPRLVRIAPNPMQGTATIDLNLEVAARVKLQILDVSGRVVDRILDQQYPAGDQRIIWHLSQGAFPKASSGTYYLSLEAEGHRSVRPVTLLR